MHFNALQTQNYALGCVRERRVWVWGMVLCLLYIHATPTPHYIFESRFDLTGSMRGDSQQMYPIDQIVCIINREVHSITHIFSVS
jgi:hypothetical protein